MIVGSIQDPPIKAKPFVDLDVLASIHPELMDESFVYVHCHVNSGGQEMLVRIWKDTFLMDRGTSNKSSLIHAENITYAPRWTFIPAHQPYSFLLIFSSLPKSCKQFDLVEQAAGSGGFLVKNIPRNETDVYRVQVV